MQAGYFQLAKTGYLNLAIDISDGGGCMGGRNVVMIRRIHWCWYEPEPGRRNARDELLVLKNSDPVTAKAVAKLVVNMSRLMNGQSRDRNPEPVVKDVWELKSRVSNRQIRMLYLSKTEHRVAVTVFHKTYDKLKPKDIDLAARASDQWIVDYCRENIDLNHL